MRLLLPLATLGFAALALGATCAIGDGDGGVDSAKAVEYQVRVSFNESVTQAGLDETSAILSAYDEGLDYLIQESFPPTGVATLSTDAADFCSRVTADLEAKPYVTGVDCTKTEDIPTSANPDEPVSSTPEYAPGSEGE